MTGGDGSPVLAFSASSIAALDDLSRLRAIVRGGDRADAAAAALYADYAPRFLRLFRLRFHASEEDAEDLLQATFEKIIALRRLPPDLEAPGAYLWRIAVNCAQDWLRRQRPEISVGGTMELEPLHTGLQPDHAQSFIASESLRRAFTRFARDHPERAAALTLLVVEQWNGTELAAYLQRSPGASREYLSQCRKVLQGYVDAENQDSPVGTA